MFIHKGVATESSINLEFKERIFRYANERSKGAKRARDKRASDAAQLNVFVGEGDEG